MSPAKPLSPRSASSRSSLGSLLFALVITAGFARAELPASRLPTAPPDFPDTVHLENGCYISTLVYLAKFTAAYPGERAVTLSVQPRTYDEPHTIALLSWQGRWWGRDEYCGVFEIKCAVGDAKVNEAVRSYATEALDRLAARLVKLGRTAVAPATPRHLSAERRARDIAAARTLLPCATEQFSVRSEGREIPVLFFRPTPDQIAVYDPQTGTATAETKITDAARIVALVAARLGYRTEAVEREALPFPSVLVASSEVSKGGLSR